MISKKTKIENHICRSLQLERILIGNKHYYIRTPIAKLKPSIECFLRDEIRFITRAIKRLKGYKEYYMEHELQFTIDSMESKLKAYNKMLKQLTKK